ncbi:restriction endonuclease subunit S [Aliarcobacter skirrowii]|uniref:restriction endonuclease subunit S n=1 Tax=Aliarcobacter skirrowii TaxID=28200 RepID=UPI0029A158BC|nr:restriction endonuclease subunit S [Aliarcobacter skirrowii]MDX4057358.1 restriction endonuclease subunit S [Aliarcobacter skirrowii]
MSDLPKGWEEVNFDNFFKTISAKKYQIQKKDYLQKSIYPVIDQGQKFIIAYSNQSDKLLKNSSGLIIFGDHTRIIKFIDFDFIVGADGTQILDTKSNVDIKFAYYTLLFKEIVSLGYSRHFKIIKEFNYLVPPLEEQKKIADILTTVDKKIAFVEENISATEKLKKGLMQKLLTEGIGHTEFKDSELGRIPESWEVVQFDKVCDIRDGTHDSPKYIESGIPFITSKHLTDNGIDFTETNYISKENHIEFSKRSKVDNGDILFGMIGTIGKPIIVNTDFEFSIKNIALLKLSCNELLSNIYVLNLLKSNIITKQFSKLSNGGVQSFIALGMIRKLKIPLPPLEEQKQIAEILSTVDNKLENLKEKKLFFEELKKGLMQKLLTGEVRV